MTQKNNSGDIRKARNEQLIQRMKAGEPLWSYDSRASWFPPRPIIEKDPVAIKRLYESGSQAQQGVYKSSTVQHIEARLSLKTSEKKAKTEDVG